LHAAQKLLFVVVTHAPQNILTHHQTFHSHHPPSIHTTPTPPTPPIQADLSRCHAVDTLIGSAPGRINLSQLLLALLVSEPKFSYIQGMDSLAAVCLKLFYSSPPRALLLLRAVIDRFLGKVVYKVRV